MANKSDKRIAAENASTRTLLLAGTALTQLLQLLLFAISSRQRTRAHVLLYLFTSLPSLFFTQQLYGMASPKYSSSGALVSAGADLTQPGLTQYMQDVIYVTWAAQLFGLIWSKGWWLYALIPSYALYKIINIVSPFIFGSKGSSASGQRQQKQQEEQAAAAKAKEGMSKRQQKMQARYEKGDKRYQMHQRPQS